MSSGASDPAPEPVADSVVPFKAAVAAKAPAPAKVPAAAKVPTTRQPLASRTPNTTAKPVTPKVDNSAVAAVDDDNWDSSSEDDAEPTAVADARQAATERAQAAVVVARPNPSATIATVAATAVVPSVDHDPSSWDSDDDSDDTPAPAPAPRRAALPPGARLKPDGDFAALVDCMEPEAIGGAGYNGKLQKLKCTTCGTDVLRFANARWSDGTEGYEAVDYLFFRYFSGHSLDVNRLRERLLPDSAKAAYACQCSWQSVAGLKKLSAWGTPPGDEGGTGGGGTSLRWLPQED
jgi:hypothetical protein|eukprot:COSAG02_NODE_221_length_28385_cov_5.795164_6_plen_292_part_00